MAQTRRSLAAAASALAVAFIPAASSAVATAGQTSRRQDILDPDAALIALCDQHAVNCRALSTKEDLTDTDEAWVAFNATCDAIYAARPAGFSGCVAMARAIKVEATQPGGQVELEAVSADWALQLVNDLIRIGGRA